MGYSGFGLQKWIYRQRPRRPFSKDRKAHGDTIPKMEHSHAFGKDGVSLSALSKKELSPEERRQ